MDPRGTKHGTSYMGTSGSSSGNEIDSLNAKTGMNKYSFQQMEAIQPGSTTMLLD